MSPLRTRAIGRCVTIGFYCGVDKIRARCNIGGSMVGETAVLSQAGSEFLHRSNEIDYIEGVGQNRTWLRQDPMRQIEELPINFIRLEADNSVFGQFMANTRHYNDHCEGVSNV